MAIPTAERSTPDFPTRSTTPRPRLVERATEAVETRLVHPPPVPGGPDASSTPIYQTATFAVSEDSAWDYTRSGNPTRDVLERQLEMLDGAERSLAYASGMAAVAAVLRSVPCGSTILAGDDLYGGTMRFLAALAVSRDLEVRFVDVTDLDQVREALEPETSLVWLETPSNLVCDVRTSAPSPSSRMRLGRG